MLTAWEQTRVKTTDYDTSNSTDAQADNKPVKDSTKRRVSLGQLSTLGTHVLFGQEYAHWLFGWPITYTRGVVFVLPITSCHRQTASTLTLVARATSSGTDERATRFGADGRKLSAETVFSYYNDE